mgnify:CR=1 FL=1
MEDRILGLHHITAIAGEAKRNFNFYTRTLGLRLVKKTVNFDDPTTYHLYYGDKAGSPGTIITFFPWEGMETGRRGAEHPQRRRTTGRPLGAFQSRRAIDRAKVGDHVAIVGRDEDANETLAGEHGEVATDVQDAVDDASRRHLVHGEEVVGGVLDVVPPPLGDEVAAHFTRVTELRRLTDDDLLIARPVTVAPPTESGRPARKGTSVEPGLEKIVVSPSRRRTSTAAPSAVSSRSVSGGLGRRAATTTACRRCSPSCPSASPIPSSGCTR